MKFIATLTLLFSLGAGAMLKKASIDGSLSQKYDENYEETQRSLAGEIEIQTEEKNKREKNKRESEKEERKEKEDAKDRVPSSEGQSFQNLNENGIRYWKY